MVLGLGGEHGCELVMDALGTCVFFADEHCCGLARMFGEEYAAEHLLCCMMRGEGGG